MATPPSAIVTFLFTDIEGSTKLLRELGRDLYRERFSAHAHVIRKAVERHGGRIVDSTGDAFFIAFPFASGAVEAAVEAQRALAADPSLPRVRMGVHTGEASESDGAYIGVAVHRAARVAAAAHGGQVLLSNATAGVVADELPDDVGLRDLGLQPLKDIAQPARLFQLEIDGLTTSFPPPRSDAPPALEVAPVRSSRRFWIPALAALVAILAVVPVVALLIGHDEGRPRSVRLDVNSVGVIDPDESRVVAAIPVGGRPTQVVVDSSGVWTLNEGDDTVSWIEPEARRVKRTFPVGRSARGLAPAAGGVWVTAAPGGNVVLEKIDPDYSGATIRADVSRVIPGPTVVRRLSQQEPRWISSADGSIWVTYSDDVIRYDPSARRLRLTKSERGALGQIAADEEGAWILTPPEVGGALEGRKAELFRFDAATGAFVGTPTVLGGGYAALAVRGDDVWIARESGVVRIAPDGSITDVISANVGVPSGVAIDDGGVVWVADSSGGRVVQVDPKSKRVTVIRLAHRPDGIAAGDGKIWVTVY